MNVKHIPEKNCKNLENSKIWKTTCDDAGNFKKNDLTNQAQVQ